MTYLAMAAAAAASSWSWSAATSTQQQQAAPPCSVDEAAPGGDGGNSSWVGGGNASASLSKEQMSEMLHAWARKYFVYQDVGNVVLISCYVPLFLLAAVANTLVIVVVLKYHNMRSVTNYFLVNLSVADLLVTLVCMPMAVGLSVTKQWLYGEFMCKFTYYLQAVSVGASVFTITAMSIDRYLAIRHPMAFRKIFNRSTTILVIFLLWLVALVIFCPILLVRHISYLDRDILVGSDTHILGFCYEDWDGWETRPVYGVFCFVTVYAVPGSVVVLAYSLMGLRLCAVSPPMDGDEGASSTRQGSRLVRERRRVARILLLLAVMFALCWLPHNVFALVMDLELLDLTRGDPLSVFSYTLLLGHANSAVNPLLYCFMTRNFRNAVRELVLRSGVSLASRPHQRCKVLCTPLSSYKLITNPYAASKRHHVKRLRFVPQSAPAVLRASHGSQQSRCAECSQPDLTHPPTTTGGRQSLSVNHYAGGSQKRQRNGGPSTV